MTRKPGGNISPGGLIQCESATICKDAHRCIHSTLHYNATACSVACQKERCGLTQLPSRCIPWKDVRHEPHTPQQAFSTKNEDKRPGHRHHRDPVRPRPSTQTGNHAIANGPTCDRSRTQHQPASLSVQSRASARVQLPGTERATDPESDG